MSGTLYLVATPIGNYDDITFRALNVLKSVDVVVYEERKEGQRLLSHYGIPEKLVESLNEHNEAAASFHIIEHLKQGKSVALISDAGTPVFSDPGQVLVRKAVESNVKVVPIPGASSLMPALTVSGFSIEQFLYYGFPSPKANRRIAELRQLRNERRTIIFMDAPYRLVPLLRDLAEVFGNERRVCIAFNLTMRDEQIFRGTAAELFRYFEKKGLKGEFVVIVEGTGTRR
ncbi:MAG: 16S rRNA (cytidine(1402)-2'-O)-methyltransferase [Ignavibacteriae bacterium]|nr:16S rRNA (cytidine(1402)-2'-O)-methyltransferase [Ignavibacteria bacterium]MBI3364145.1 16S rRNA (cytidine(1402)-2'-O)-methyltransferase [Ignavibacteriota bacterium]